MFVVAHSFRVPTGSVGSLPSRTRSLVNARACLFSRLPLFTGSFNQTSTKMQWISRGELGYFLRTIVRYTGINPVTKRGLYPVLRTRPDLIPPQICLPSTLRYGAYLYVDPRICLRMPIALPYVSRRCVAYPRARMPKMS